MARPCGHADDAGTSTSVTETSTEVVTIVKCQCGQQLSRNAARKLRASRPGTGGKPQPRRRGGQDR